MTVSACSHDPVPVLVTALTQAAESGRLHLGDVLADSGYAHRVPSHFALPLRAARADLVVDLHPQDRGPQGTHGGAICHNGNLYCPRTPTKLFELSPLARDSSVEEVSVHDERAAELARYKLGRLTATDEDGFHRVGCPAVAGKLRCPLRAASMALDYTRLEVLAPPEHPPTCCTQVTITVPPSVNAKTRQKHDYLQGLASLLRAPHRRRALERPDQGSHHDRHRKGLVPADGPRRPDALPRRRARGPQPRDRRRLRGTTHRERAQDRRRPPATDSTATATHDAR